MARIKYQPSTRVKPFNPIQLSKEGITQMRRDSDQKIQGMEQNFQAEKEQQARDRAAMQENAALEQDRIKRDREIEIENLKNEQTALSKQINIDKEQAKFDSEASNAIFESISSISQTAASYIAKAEAEKLKKDTKKAQEENLGDKRKGLDQYYNDLNNSIKKGTVAFDADVTENAVLSGEERWQTTLGYLSNPGRNFNVNQINANTLIKDQGTAIFAKAFNGTDRIYTDSAGNKFSGVEGYNDPIRNRIVTDTEHKNFVEKLGLDYAAEGYLSSSSAELEKVKDTLAKSSVERSLKKSLEIGESKLKTLRSGTAENIAEAWDFESVLKGKGAAWEATHLMTANPENSIEMLSEAHARIMGVPMKEYNKNPEKYSILNEDHPRYAQTKLQLAARNNNRTKAINANIKFKKAQRDQFELETIDIIRAAFDQNPTQAFRAAQEQAHYQGLTVSERVKGIHTAAIADKKDQELSVLQTKLRFSSLDESYVNSIQDPTVRKQGIEALAQQEEQKYGPAALGIKKGFRATARKLTDINPNEGNDSPQTFLVQARLESEYLKQLAITQDPIAANAKVNEMIDKAAAGDKNSPFYSETGTNNRLVFTNIETVDTDLSEKNLMIDKRMATFGANVASQAFLLANNAEMDATILSAQSGGTVTYSKGILRVADKFGLKPSEVFNQQQQARNLVTGINHPLLTPSIGTETVDAMDPATLKYHMKAKEFNSHMSALNANARFTGTVNNNVRSSMQQVYTVGNIGPTSTGPHLDVKRVDGGRFEANALDKYVVVNDPEFGNISLGEIRKRTGGIGDNWDQHVARGSHGIDYGIHDGTAISITNGAKVVSNSPTEHGDYLIIELPSGDQYSFLHGKGMM